MTTDQNATKQTVLKSTIISRDRVQLWRRSGGHYALEGRVGNVEGWISVTNETFQNYLEAEKALDRAILNGGWREGRIVELQVTTVATTVYSRHREVILRVPESMKLLDRKGNCPVCLTSSPLAGDGRDIWVFCPVCSKALPWRE